MINLISVFLFFTFSVFQLSADAMTCSKFNDLGGNPNSIQQIINVTPTVAQIEEFKIVIADHSGSLAGGRGTANQKKAIVHLSKVNKLGVYMRESLAMTRVECFNRPNESMEEVAVEQFDFLLNALIKYI